MWGQSLTPVRVRVCFDRGQKIIDLWGRQEGLKTGDKENGSDYDGDSLQISFSSSKVATSCVLYTEFKLVKRLSTPPILPICTLSNIKVVTSVCVAMAVDRGYLQYDAPVCQYWPEFAQAGKAGITVADVMRHSAGLASFEDGTTVTIEQAGDLDWMAECMAVSSSSLLIQVPHFFDGESTAVNYFDLC